MNSACSAKPTAAGRHGAAEKNGFGWEELRTVNDPTLAIETPIGKPLLPTLSGGTNENPANLEMDALKGETSADKVGDVSHSSCVMTYRP